VTDLATQAFRRHYRQIYRYVRRRSASDADAEDVTQEVFADAAAALDRFKPGSPPVLAWLYTVAQRRLADEARRAARRPHNGSAAALDRFVRAGADAPEYGRAVADAVRRALARLPESQRRVVVLKLFEGRTFAEIAAVVGTTEAAAKMRVARGLEQIRDDLEQEGIAP
jgi:RNA polymerase sigma-70 factor (ECF subfamily)